MKFRDQKTSLYRTGPGHVRQCVTLTTVGFLLILKIVWYIEDYLGKILNLDLEKYLTLVVLILENLVLEVYIIVKIKVTKKPFIWTLFSLDQSQEVS